MKKKREKLFSEFPPVSTERWMEEVTADLKGVPFEKRLVWRTKEGFNLMPFYRAEDVENLKVPETLPGQFPYLRGTKVDNKWLIREELGVVGSPSSVNEQLKTLIDKGITAVGLHFTDGMISTDTIKAVLKDIDLNELEVNFYARHNVVLELADAVVAGLKGLGYDLAKVHGSIGFNPFRHILSTGNKWDAIETAVELLKRVEPLKEFTCFSVQSVDFVNAGAYIYQELGYALAAGANIIDEVAEKSGVTRSTVAERVRFEMGIGSNYFIEIAKFRAIRWLWALIVKGDDEIVSERAMKAVVHAESSRWNKTVYDAYVNLLRTQTEAMSATIAGVHSLTVLPFDVAYSHGSDFSKRIARNQQHLLNEESHFDKVTDPAGGSYYVEHLTDAVAAEAWKLFLEVEEQGGFTKLANSGKIQEAINASNAERRSAVATRRENLLGTNIFPNFNEVITDEKLKGLEQDAPQQGNVTALDTRRGAYDFEQLRIATDKLGDKRPKVFMLTIGKLAMRLARSQFSSNFFATAGYHTIDNLGFNTVEEGVEAAIKAKADLVVLCSSDEEYATYGPEAYDALAGRLPLVIAGAPACMEDLKAKGIEHFIHVKVNVLETLQMFNELLGVTSKN
ncbi:MAG: methylmalonyl-CoA mutase small subunit [Porphyromonas sp.]|nr:methylmalonyl-CoA mutase small subunit [Porphyromonas sp.]